MKHKLLSLLLVALCVTAVAVAEEPTPSSFPQQQIDLEAFTLSLDYDWIPKELTQEDADNGLLLQAERADGSQTLMVFQGDEASFDDILEMTARNEYAGLEKREAQQTYNDIQFAFTTSEENQSSAAYISLDGTLYSFLLMEKGESSASEQTPLETLQSCLITLATKR